MSSEGHLAAAVEFPSVSRTLSESQSNFVYIGNNNKMSTIKKKERVYTFQGTRLHLTIHRHLTNSGDLCISSIRKLTSISPKLRAFNEIGKTGHKHSHVVCLWPKRVTIGSKKKWNSLRNESGGFNMKPISSDEHMLKALGYDISAKKGGIENESVVIIDELKDWKPDIPYHQQAINHLLNVSTWRQALVGEFSEYLCSKLTWAKEVFTSRPIRFDQKKLLEKVFPWQQTTISFIDANIENPDDRTIHWIYDKTGSKGKSKLITHLLHEYGAMVFDGGKHQDMTYAYRGQSIVAFDLCRSTEDYCPYRTMERFKDGRCTVAKYQSHTKYFKIPLVFVFANFPPKLEELTANRWNVVTINEDYALSAPLTRFHVRCSTEYFEFEKFLKPLVSCKGSSGVASNVKPPPARLQETLDRAFARSKNALLKQRPEQENVPKRKISRDLLCSGSKEAQAFEKVGIQGR